MESDSAVTIGESSAINYQAVDPDVRLMLRVRDDDAQAFEELVARYQARLLGVLEHLAGEADLAQDLAQEVFLRVYRARKTYSPDAKFCTWLFRIANNVASNSRRGKSRRREVQPALPDIGQSGPQAVEPMALLAVAKSGSMPVRKLEKRELANIVRAAVESLTERQRMAVLLSKFQEMSYLDIADAMEMSVPAIKSLLSRARSNLKSLLEPYLKQGLLPAAGGLSETGEM